MPPSPPPPPPKPYDARIEYLESRGKQFIDTGIYPDFYTKVACVISGLFNNKRIFGARGNEFQDRQFECIFYDTQEYGMIFRFADFGNYSFRPENYDKVFTIEMDYNGAVVNNNQIRFEQASYFTVPRTLLLFANHFNTGPGDFATAKMFSFKIWQNSELVRDYIPVRIGQVGYMYDNVSGQIFGNEGTTEFVLGPDIG